MTDPIAAAPTPTSAARRKSAFSPSTSATPAAWVNSTPSTSSWSTSAMEQPQINLPKPSPSPRRDSPPFNLHPSYGLTDEFRLRVLAYANATSVAKAAAHFNIHHSTIYNWLKALNT